METHQELIRTERGVVHTVPKRNAFQIDFGNVYMVLDDRGLRRFTKFIEQTDEDQLEKLKVGPSNKIFISPCKASLCFAFEEEEFMHLRELLTGAVSLLGMEKEIEEILS